MSCQVMYQPYYPYFNPYQPQSPIPPSASASAGSPNMPMHESSSSPTAMSSQIHHHRESSTSPPTNSLSSHSSKLKRTSATYEAVVSGASGLQQYSGSDSYDHQQHYLSPSSVHVQQPLPASTMASSVAALQRLSASIDISHQSNLAAAASSSRSNSRTSAYEDKAEEKSDSLTVEDIGELASGRPQQLAANCVVYSFYSGDLATAIDEHFSRALKKYSQDSPSQQETTTKQPSDSPVPMKQRELPDSFWNSDYYLQHSQHSLLSQHQAAAMHPQHQQQQYDPYVEVYGWHNYMNHHPRETADMYYSCQYPSALLTSFAARSAQGRQAAAALGKAPTAADSWAAAADASFSAAAATAAAGVAAAGHHSHYSAAMTGLEGTMQAPSKDRYWF